VRPYFLAWFLLHNISGSLPPACLSAPPEPDARYLCMFPQYILPHIDATVPLFISQSLADSTQQSFVMRLGCDPKNATPPGVCNQSQLEYLHTFRREAITALAPVLNSPSRGAFTAECSIHVIVNNDGSWSEVAVQGQTQATTFDAWYANSTSLSQRVIDGPWGSNPSCHLYSPD
jgi:hypothetical protein